MMVLAHSGYDHVTFVAIAIVLVAGFGAVWWRDAARSLVRFGCWTIAVVLVLLASSPRFEHLAEHSFTGHMVQHLVVIIGAAPLFVLARPLHTMLAAGVIRTTPFGRRVGAAWHRAAPLIAPVLFLGVLFATHLTAIYDDALGNRWLHEAEHAGYLLGSVAVWAAVLATRKANAPARIAAVFGIIAGSALLAVILMTAKDPLVPTYAAHLGDAEAVEDQRAAAALMWVSGMATTLPLMVASVWRWAATEDRIARRHEALLDGTLDSGG